MTTATASQKIVYVSFEEFMKKKAFWPAVNVDAEVNEAKQNYMKSTDQTDLMLSELTVDVPLATIVCMHSNTPLYLVNVTDLLVEALSYELTAVTWIKSRTLQMHNVSEHRGKYPEVIQQKPSAKQHAMVIETADT